MVRALVVLCAFAILLTTGGPALSQALPSDASRAQQSFAVLQHVFGTYDGSHLYRERYPVASTDSRYSNEWPFSQVHVAALDLTGLPGRLGASYDQVLVNVDAGQMHYWQSTPASGKPGFDASVLPPYGTGGTIFYDDNEWVGLESIQDYAQHHSRAALDQAQAIFDLAVSGWDNNTSHARPGGVYWMEGRNRNRNTVSNMPAAELGLRLYLATGRADDLSWAEKMYGWTNSNLQSGDGLYYDHVDLKGDVDQSLWTYNQGVPISVNVLLYEITHDRSYLEQAKRVASAVYQYFIVGNRLQSQPVTFNAILFKHLLAFEAETGGTKFRTAIQAYADQIWDQSRDPKTGIFHFPDSRRTDVIEQAAATQIFATLALPPGVLLELA